MSLLDLARRFVALSAPERSYFLRRFLDLRIHARSGFAQFGEDASVAAYLRALRRTCRTYIDIGANDPVLHSNSYLFYRDGAAGLLVEANPARARRLARRRPRDTVVNAAVVAAGSGIIELHVVDFDGLSTVSAKRRDELLARNLGRVIQTVRVPAMGINDLLARHAPAAGFDLASLDIEDLDFEVASAWDFDRWRPFLFCAETTVVTNDAYTRDGRFTALMAQRGYRPLFETFANTVFVNERG
jgi:FkbM family methyltransferase